jgi:cephalosporin hydroxylase
MLEYNVHIMSEIRDIINMKMTLWKLKPSGILSHV